MIAALGVWTRILPPKRRSSSPPTPQPLIFLLERSVPPLCKPNPMTWRPQSSTFQELTWRSASVSTSRLYTFPFSLCFKWKLLCFSWSCTTTLKPWRRSRPMPLVDLPSPAPCPKSPSCMVWKIAALQILPMLSKARLTLFYLPHSHLFHQVLSIFSFRAACFSASCD